MEKEAMYKLTYGLFVLTAKNGEKQNGCIVNTVSMITDEPKRITVYVNKSNFTESLIRETGELNVSVLTEKTPFEVFKQFGFCSGRDTDKFAGKQYPQTENGLYYIPEVSNAVISAKVVGAHDYGTHTLFVAEVTEAKTLSTDKSVTYEYYQSSIKPKPQAQQGGQEKWVCKVCGYVHEGPLPDDFICPWCKHPASDFEKMQ
ncbi:MAG: flavin reductase [Clostridia bacterium]|nr:flavin reductase [Clostridia bacterium]